MTKSTEIPTKPIVLEWDDDILEDKEVCELCHRVIESMTDTVKLKDLQVYYHAKCWQEQDWRKFKPRSS
jgi:hypothetical protein